MSEQQALQDLKNLSGAWEERAPADINLKSLSNNLAYMTARNPLQDFTCFNKNRQTVKQDAYTPRTNLKTYSSSATNSINHSRRCSILLTAGALPPTQQQQETINQQTSSFLNKTQVSSVPFPNDRFDYLPTNSESRVNSETSVSMKAHHFDTYYLQGSNRSFYSNENINPTQKPFSMKSKVNNNLLLKLQQNNSLDPPKREYIKMLWQIKAKQSDATSTNKKNQDIINQSAYDSARSTRFRTEPSSNEFNSAYSSIENPYLNRESQRIITKANIKLNKETSKSHHQTKDQSNSNLHDPEPHAQLRSKPKNRFSVRAPTTKQNSDDQTNTIILALPPLQTQILKPFQIPNPLNIYSSVSASSATSCRLHSTDSQQQQQSQQNNNNNNNERQQNNKSCLSVKRDMPECQQQPTIKSKNTSQKQSQNNNPSNAQKKYIDLSILMKQPTASTQPEIKILENPSKQIDQSKENHSECSSNKGDEIIRKVGTSASDIRVKQITEILMNTTKHDSPKQVANHFKRRNSSYSSPIAISKNLDRNWSVAPPQDGIPTKIFVKSSAKTNIQQKLTNMNKINNSFSHRITKSLSDEALAIEPSLFPQSPSTAQALMSIILAEKQPAQMRIELFQKIGVDSQDPNNKQEKESSKKQLSTQSQIPITKRKIKYSDEMAVALMSSKFTRLISKNSTKPHIHPLL